MQFDKPLLLFFSTQDKIQVYKCKPAIKEYNQETEYSLNEKIKELQLNNCQYGQL